MMPNLNFTMRLAAAVTGLALIFSGCEKPSRKELQGYVEGDFVYVSAASAGQLLKLHVQRGQQVKAGDPLFDLDPEPEQSRLAEAEHRVAGAGATLADLKKGRRPSEVAALEAQLQEAQAALVFAKAELERQKALTGGGATTERDRELAASNEAQAVEQVKKLQAELKTAELGAREDQIAAAEAELKAAEAVLAQSRWAVLQKKGESPNDAVVYDTLYREGEWVAAGKPVVSLLPPDHVKIRIFVPEPLLTRIHVGDTAVVQTSSQTASIRAKVSFISPQAEYTPPVLYSRDNRARLVFMVELRPEGAAGAALQPGLPVDVTFDAPATGARP